MTPTTGRRSPWSEVVTLLGKPTDLVPMDPDQSLLKIPSIPGQVMMSIVHDGPGPKPVEDPTNPWPELQIQFTVNPRCPITIRCPIWCVAIQCRTIIIQSIIFPPRYVRHRKAWRHIHQWIRIPVHKQPDPVGQWVLHQSWTLSGLVSSDISQVKFWSRKIANVLKPFQWKKIGRLLMKFFKTLIFKFCLIFWNLVFSGRNTWDQEVTTNGRCPQKYNVVVRFTHSMSILCLFHHHPHHVHHHRHPHYDQHYDEPGCWSLSICTFSRFKWNAGHRNAHHVS